MIGRGTAAFLIVAAVALPARAEGGPPPFEADLLRLSGILGAVSYLDRLCGSPDAGVWRGKMQALIDGQGMAAEDRRRYVDVFNRGYRTFASVHRLCTDATRSVLRDYLAEGGAIAGKLEERFGRGPKPGETPRETAGSPAPGSTPPPGLPTD